MGRPTERTRQRIKRVVETVEAQPVDLTGGKRTPRPRITPGTQIAMFKVVTASATAITARSWDGVIQGAEIIGIETPLYPPRLEAGDEIWAFQYKRSDSKVWRLIWEPEQTANVPDGYVLKVVDGFSEWGLVTLVQ